MLAKLDLDQPFSREKSGSFNAEEIMISQDFILELVPAISQTFSEKKVTQMKTCIDAFEQLMGIVLDGINAAIKVASGSEIALKRLDTIYQIHPKTQSKRVYAFF